LLQLVGFWLFVTIFRHISELVDGLQSQSPNGAARASEMLVAAFKATTEGFLSDIHRFLASRCAVLPGKPPCSAGALRLADGEEARNAAARSALISPIHSGTSAVSPL